MSKRWIGSIAALALLLASASAVAGAFSKTYERIPGWDGAQMGALVLVPQGQGAGPFPLIVMPASWSLPNLEYLGRATQLASDGYVVVSYTSRGFWDSAGQIDIAGPDTVEDVSAVIDWALAHTPANPDAIGASGISYGAGISLLAAERDPRIKAVAALSGWADLEAALYSNRTVSQQGVGLLVGAGALTGRAGPDLAQIGARVAQGDYDGAVQGFLPQAASRSPATDVAALNARGTRSCWVMPSTTACFRRTRPSRSSTSCVAPNNCCSARAITPPQSCLVRWDCRMRSIPRPRAGSIAISSRCVMA